MTIYYWFPPSISYECKWVYYQLILFLARISFQLLLIFQCLPWPLNYHRRWNHNHCQCNFQISNICAGSLTSRSDSPFYWLIHSISVPSVTPKQSLFHGCVFLCSFWLHFLLFVCLCVHPIHSIASFWFFIATAPKYSQNTSKYAGTARRLDRLLY